ncbi:flavoprotein, partial [Micromonospora sp. M51]|uniref:flavoprotein n=1 Tax=Micromonospora sp. M51 TaxID=2824889 RepID=UPI00273932EE
MSASIVLGVGGGIAAYKACELLRLFTESGHRVRVVPTASALRFVGAPTWAALSGQPVADDVWTDVHEVPHVRLGKQADLVVVAPPDGSLVPFRFVDALVGGVVALAASLLVDARHPLAPLVAEVRRTFDELAGLLDGIADALDDRDEPAAVAALRQARGMDARVDGLRDGVLAAGEAL